MVIIALQSKVYNDWRHMYFLRGPFCLLAAIGLHTIVNSRKGGIWKIGTRLPRWVGGNVIRRPLAYGIAGVGLITTLTAMAALHPNQQVYFNALVDTKTPGALGECYDMDYYAVAQWQPWNTCSCATRMTRCASGRKAAARRACLKKIETASRSRPRMRLTFVRQRVDLWNDTEPLAIHSVRAYVNVIAFILAPNTAAYRDYYRAEYYDAAANGTLLTHADFPDLH